MQSPDEVDTRQAAALAYENAGREISQAFGVLNSNLTLAAGTLGALLAVLGAGELFGSEEIRIFVEGASVKSLSAPVRELHGVPKFSNVALLLLAAAFPLVVRFFIRATTGYQQLERFNLVQRKTWGFLAGMISWHEALGTVDLYVQQWKSPKPLKKLLAGSFKYGFAWVFALALIALGWAFYSAPDDLPRVVAAAFLVLGVGWEALTLRRSPYFAVPTDAESERLRTAPPHPSTRSPDESSSALVEEQRGLFLGRRRLFHRGT